ncbi:WXG100 family type VII secretion target [Yimella sp. cx-51]|uniref:WXG100 family type VII secretion target n=1 Tax=Yimella sp. cx-51 TaxID=2770551 RepID=UPI00165DE288|nr:hypothetical protein [Yimella sp. cx-51]MBC9955946.1 hypothetical protein [Yimella sp. cx-51]QTH37514.1 hypothetical protein J5M86_11610 [Yimella sp. cx-51]
MAYKGMDDAQVESSATQLAALATKLDALVVRCDVLVGNVAGHWHGQDAQTFRDQWYSVHRRSLTGAAAQVHGMADSLRRNVTAQRDASGADPGAAGVSSPRSRGSDGSATSPSLMARLRDGLGVSDKFLNESGLGALTTLDDLLEAVGKEGFGSTAALGKVFGAIGVGASVAEFVNEPSWLGALHVAQNGLMMGSGPAAVAGVGLKAAESLGTHLAEGIAAGNFTPEAAKFGFEYARQHPIEVLQEFGAATYQVLGHDLLGLPDQAQAHHGGQEFGELVRGTDFSPAAARQTFDYAISHPGETFEAISAAPGQLWDMATGGNK